MIVREKLSYADGWMYAVGRGHTRRCARLRSRSRGRRPGPRSPAAGAPRRDPTVTIESGRSAVARRPARRPSSIGSQFLPPSRAPCVHHERALRSRGDAGTRRGRSCCGTSSPDPITSKSVEPRVDRPRRGRARDRRGTTSPREPENSGWKRSRCASGSSCRHGIRIVRSGATWPQANAGQNRYGAKTSAR